MFVKLKLSSNIQEEFVQINAKRKTPDIEALTTSIAQIISNHQLAGFQNKKRKSISL